MAIKFMKIYALIICLIMTMILFFVTTQFYNIATDLYLNKYKYSANLKKFTSNEEFIKYLGYKEQKSFADSSEIDITKERVKRKEEYLDRIKSKAISNLVNYTGSLLITIIFLLIHWKLYNKAESNNLL